MTENLAAEGKHELVGVSNMSRSRGAEGGLDDLQENQGVDDGAMLQEPFHGAGRSPGPLDFVPSIPAVVLRRP